MIKNLSVVLILAFIFISGCASQQDVQNVNFHIIDYNNASISQALVNVEPSSDNSQYYSNQFGALSIKMSKSNTYVIKISNPSDGQIYQFILQPNDTNYTFRLVPRPTQTPTQTQIPTHLYLPEDFTRDANTVTNIALNVFHSIFG